MGNKIILTIFLSIIGLSCVKEIRAGAFEGSRVLGAGVASDSSIFPTASSSTLSANMMVVSTGATIVYGIHMTSGAAVIANAATVQAGSYVIFFDTGTAGSTVAIDTITATQFSILSPTSVQFNPPLRFYKGVTTRATSCATNLVGWCYTVLYDKLRGR